MILFHKYHGTGNDFVIIDDREESFDINNNELVAQMCNRRFGIGADGLILLRNHDHYDFQMVYFNADGNESSMCGNGGRCIVAFAYKLGLFKESCTFMAIDGLHEASINDGEVKLQMKDVDAISLLDKDYVMNTGSPHYVKFVDDAFAVDVDVEGAKIRYNDTYMQEGINVNFVSLSKEGINVTTYERGVEAETYSCGTGVTACAIAFAASQNEGLSSVSITTKGGKLKVYINYNGQRATEVYLEGGTTFVYQGSYVPNVFI